MITLLLFIIRNNRDFERLVFSSADHSHQPCLVFVKVVTEFTARLLNYYQLK